MGAEWGGCSCVDIAQIGFPKRWCACRSVPTLTPKMYGPAWINHYRCKTIGEFVRQKVRRGDASEAQFEEQYDDLSQFFLDNPYNKEKANYAVALYAQLYPKKKK